MFFIAGIGCMLATVFLIFNLKFKNPMDYVAILFFATFGIGLTAMTTTSFWLNVRDNGIKKRGTSAEGSYISHETNVSVDRIDYYKISFSFVNKNGNTVVATTRSLYRVMEAKVLAAMKNFPIKYIGHKAVIDIDKMRMQKEIQNYIMEL